MIYRNGAGFNLSWKKRASYYRYYDLLLGRIARARIRLDNKSEGPASREMGHANLGAPGVAKCDGLVIGPAFAGILDKISPAGSDSNPRLDRSRNRQDSLISRICERPRRRGSSFEE